MSIEDKEKPISNVQTADDNEPEESYFGYGPFRPKCLQFLNHRWCLIFIVCLQVFVSGMMISGFVGVTVSSIEKRFHLRSTEVGGLPAGEEISAAVTGFIASYYAGQRHKGRFLSAGALATGIGAIVYSLPHFFAGEYQPISTASNYTDLCVAKSASFAAEVCAAESVGSNAYVRNFFFVFILGQLIMGAGNNLLWNIGCAYVSENVHPKSSAMYIAAMMTVSTLGPSIGYIAGGNILTIYINTPKSPPEGITIFDARWIGAWWILFLIAGGGLILISIPLFGFPRFLPGYKKFKRLRLEEAAETAKVDNEYGHSIKEIPKATKELITNVPYMLLVAGLIFEYIVVSGIGLFFVKILEAQFRLPAYEASSILGYIGLGGGATGMLLGGILMRVFNMNGSKATFLTMILSIIDVLAAFWLLFSCENLPFAGVNSAYPLTPTSSIPEFGKPILAATCNNDCMCKGVKFNPICGVDGVTYFSPCHAGCTSGIYNPTYLTTSYANCSCIKNVNQTTVRFDAVSGACTEPCPYLTPFAIGLTISIAAAASKIVPSTEAMLRSVPESQRAYAMGFNWVFLRLIASIPGPIIVGAFIDRSCTLWTKDCDGSSTCWVYDSRSISYHVVGTIAVIKFLGAICFFISWRYYKHDDTKRNSTEEEEKENRML
ncbi:Solute carrier organic anion transporter family member 4C1 [Trichoplax sp. H2]|nr:Solute carrier organic anion transporter family member 4C1 [Trichoplax sp. H2]|eukprot:RDD42635.1 Solute carrier organic anion transporter family member 4C1 [Trichoplax sp. H2]